MNGLYPNQELFISRRLMGASVSVELLAHLFRMIGWADVVHLSGTYSFPTLPTLLLCRSANKPVVWSHRGAILDAYEWEGSPNKRIKRAWEIVCNTLIRPDTVVAHVTSERELAAAQVRVPRAQTVLISNGVTVPDYLPDREWQTNDKLRLMFIGRIAPKKGIENLLLALQQINDPTISLMIYGTGPTDYKDEVKRVAKGLSLPEGAVTFVGHVDGDAKARAFYSADLCIVPSFSENFCVVVAEALAHGVPVVASQGTPWSSVVEKRCGLWVNNSPEQLANAILSIRGMPLEAMGRRGWAWMKEDFSWDSIALKMRRAYESLLR